MSADGMRAANKLIHDIIDRIRAEGATVEGAATTMTALQHVVAQVLVTWAIPVEMFVEQVNVAIRERSS